MASDDLIRIKDLAFSYQNGKKVFQNLDFSLRKKDRIGLIGPNGAGKTTLFHLIMGLLRPSAGSIEIFGRVRKSESDFTEVRQKIGLLFQDSDDQLFCPTVEEDIAFGPLNLGRSHGEAQALVRELCGQLGLSGYEKRITYRLSGGEKRLVALATVMAMRPECYLFDEPATGLDEKTTARFLDYLVHHADTYIIITHNRELLKHTVDRVYTLNGGSLKLLE
ncbi:MAG: energy-coupling factor ABC transporter ATP-binding protein [Nitrospirota bacterium]